MSIIAHIMWEARLTEREQSRTRIHWSKDSRAAMCGVYAGRFGTHRLAVEQADTGREWVVWPVNGPSGGQSGQSNTAMRAIRAANAAVYRIDQNTP
jgi:hypothetical protein